MRDELIEAAARLMAADGREDQVTVRAVARQAGVGRVAEQHDVAVVPAVTAHEQEVGPRRPVAQQQRRSS